jgi:BirA family biotin operon repressor/biotin-[acetyl-CoA-carboxylase] ligase
LVVVLGIGINVASAPDDLGRAVTSLDRVAVASSPAALVRPLSNALSVWLARWRRGSGFDEVRSAWLERAGPIGEMLTVRTGATTSGGPDDHPSGRFAGLAEDGALLLTLVDGAVRRITWGDVTLGTGKPALDRYDGSAGEGCRQSGAGQ